MNIKYAKKNFDEYLKYKIKQRIHDDNIKDDQQQIFLNCSFIY